MRRIHLTAFGCQMNKLDADLARAALARAGHILVDQPENADTLLFNTCSVRDHAEQRVLSRLAKLAERKTREPGLLVGVMGCLAERMGDALLRAAPVVDLVCGTRQFPRLPEWLARAETAPFVAVGDDTPDTPDTAGAPGPAAPHPEDRLPRDDLDAASPLRENPVGVSAFLAVMRGCDNRCSYCIVPSVRGGERSRPLADVVAEARVLARRGAREIVLLGQNIDAYGRDLNLTLADLLEALHEGVPVDPSDPAGRLPRLRFVTSHPRDVTPRLARAVRDLPRVGKLFHMPAQSGSDRVLRRMRRGYDRAAYEDRLAMLRTECPGSSVASDFIVGFPGEDDADFAATLGLVERAGFQNCYIFKYSPRPGTPAALDFPDDVPDDVKRERNRLLLAAQEKSARARTRQAVGTTVEVLVEGASTRDARRLIGRSPAGDQVVFAPEGEVADRVPGGAAPDDDAPDGNPAGGAALEGALSAEAVAAWTGRIVEVSIYDATALTLRGRRV